MTGQRFLQATVIAAALMTAAPALAQTSVSGSDIQRLQDDVYRAGSDVAKLRSSDSRLAAQLQDELDALNEEVIYLKVKLRKEGSLSRAEYADVRDRVQNLRTRARGESSSTWQGGTSSGSTGGVSGGTSGGVYSDTRSSEPRRGSQTAIPAGQEIDVRLQSQLSSGTSQVEDRFEATTMVDLSEGSRVLIPAGSVMRGVVSSVDKATRTDRKGSLTLSFDQVDIRGRQYPMRGTVTQALESEGIKGEIGRIGAGSAVGAIIGGVIGGVKGALLGVLIGGGGTMVATEGKDVTVPAGTILRVRLDSPPDVK